MIRRSTLAWVILVVGLCTGLFLVKQQVRGLEAQLAQLNESILDDQEAIHVLRAEWSYLNQPSRLGDLGRRLLHLEPRDGQGITTIEALDKQRKLRPSLPYVPRSDLDAHTSPLVSPGYATPISSNGNLGDGNSGRAWSDGTGWVRAILTGSDDKNWDGRK